MGDPRQILVTTALPYANGDIHLGHILEHCITDFWTRFQKMRGHDCLAICADDTHGAPVMLEARKRGLKPEDHIEDMHQKHIKDLGDFDIVYDHYGSTHSEKNHLIANEIYKAVKERGLVETKTITQLYCDHDGMFLPDRFVKGTCPKCKTADQYGDSCDQCGAVYDPTAVTDAKCTLCGNKPQPKDSEHCFFKLSTQEDYLRNWVKEHASEGVRKKLDEWLDDGLKDWCFTRDKPYFGFELPDMPGKYYYVWFDAPIGYISSTWSWCEANSKPLDHYWKNPNTEIYHNIGKDIVYFHTLFWPAMLKNSGFTPPKGVWVHGMLTANGEKLSKSRGTFINARTYRKHLPAIYLRYYLACKLNENIADIDLNMDDFASRVNSDLIGKITNVASRGAQMLGKKLDGRMGDLPAEGLKLVHEAQAKSEIIAQCYENRQFSKAMLHIREIADLANTYFDKHAPWKLIKEDPESTRGILTTILNLFRQMAIYLKPIIPSYADAAAELFSEAPYQWDACHTILTNHPVQPYKHLVQRLDSKKIAAMIEDTKADAQKAADLQKKADSKPQVSVEPLADEITIDDFFKVDLRVALIKEASHVEKAAKLIQLKLDLGPLGERQVFAGIKSAYKPEDLVGRHVAMVANLKPRKMKFGLSEGMVVAAGPGGEDIWLLSPDSGAQPGMRLG